MDIKESVSEIEELEEKLVKCQHDLDNIEKEIEELLSIHKKKFDKKRKSDKKKNTKKKKT